MTDKEKAIRWFENIADECDKLTSGNVAHLRAQIKGMAIRSAEYLTKRSQEPASEDLEIFRTEYVDKEIERIYPNLSPHLPRKQKLHLNVFNGEDLEIAIDKATQWQKEQDQQTIELAEEHAMLAGMMQERERMIKDAVEGGCFSYKNGYVHISCDIDEHLTDIKIGDKVKVIIIKE